MRTTSDNQKRIIYILTVIALALGISQVLMLRELANRPAREEPKPKIVEEITKNAKKNMEKYGKKNLAMNRSSGMKKCIILV